MTEYIVLQKNGDGNRWTILGRAEAHNAESAARKFGDSGEYLSVPVFNCTFVSLGSVQPPPRVTSVEVDASEYVPTQLTVEDAAPEVVA